MYHQVNEAYLNLRNRTWNETTRAGRAYEPLHWTYAGLGFVTFEECLFYHFNGNKTQEKLNNAKELFRMDDTTYESVKRFMNDKANTDKKYSHSLNEAFHSILMQREMEDEFWCSGMCQAGLFYISKPIQYGPPIRTCLSKLKHTIELTTKPFAVSSLLAAIWCLILFVMHFGLYFRPTPVTESEPGVNPDA